MRRLTRFWKALDLLPEAATDQRDWVQRLGPDWPAAAQFLRSTGRLTQAMDCPSPGGENCPRRVVHHPSGRIRAVCGEQPSVCDSIDLSLPEITILALDRAKLAKVIARVLALVGAPDRLEHAQLVYLGRHDVFAGRGIPAFLTLHTPRFLSLRVERYVRRDSRAWSPGTAADTHDAFTRNTCPRVPGSARRHADAS
jgi:hypothetical protein